MAWKSFKHYWPFVRGINQWPYKGQVMLTFDVFFDITLNKLLNKLSIWDAMTLMWCGCNEQICSRHRAGHKDYNTKLDMFSEAFFGQLRFWITYHRSKANFKDSHRGLMRVCRQFTYFSNCFDQYNYSYATASWCFKSVATRLFVQQFVQSEHKRKHQCPTSRVLCEGNPPVTDEFPAQRAKES